MLTVGKETIQALFIGTMGIKAVYIGNVKIYERPGGFLYIELKN